MKIIALVLSLCMSLNVIAANGSIEKLEKTLDEFQYTLTVEWDQKDQKFYKEQNDLFVANIVELIQTEGISHDDILKLSEKRIHDKQAYEALKIKMSLLDKNLTPQELAESLRASTQSYYSNGASWNGSIKIIVPVVIVGILLGIGIWYGVNYECVAYESRYECTEDEFGRRYDCYWDDVCVQTARKQK